LTQTIRSPVPGTGRARTINIKTDTARPTTPKVGVRRERESECKSDAATAVARSTPTLQLQTGLSWDARRNLEDEVGKNAQQQKERDLAGKPPAKAGVMVPGEYERCLPVFQAQF
jgi:hypothetical protein